MYSVFFITDTLQKDYRKVTQTIRRHELFRHYSKPLFYYSAKLIEEDTAKDIMQDVLVKLWSNEEMVVLHSK